MSLIDQFTLIITVHERQQFIESILRYYSDLPCDMENNPDYSFVDGMWKDKYEKQTSYFIESNFYSEEPTERIQVCLNDYWKAPNHSVVKTSVLRNNYSFQFENETLWPIRWYDKIWMFLACFDGNYKALPIRYGDRRNERLMNTLEGNYPKRLRKDTPWSHILFGDNLKPLINFCIDQGYDKEWSKDFVTKIAGAVP